MFVAIMLYLNCGVKFFSWKKENTTNPHKISYGVVNIKHFPTDHIQSSCMYVCTIQTYNTVSRSVKEISKANSATVYI